MAYKAKHLNAGKMQLRRYAWIYSHVPSRRGIAQHKGARFEHTEFVEFVCAWYTAATFSRTRNELC